MFSRSITLFFTSITIFVSAVTGQIGQNREFGNCTTPNKVEGKCVYLAECMQLADLVQRVDLSDHQTQLLRDSQCGYHGKHPLVCCPPRNDVLPDSDGCAVALRDRVHGGNLTRIDDYPWMALLEYKKRTNNEIQYLCGGALINPRYILTAAHCIKAPAISDNYTLTGVRLGEWDLSTTIDCEADDCNDPPVDVGVEEIITHENYNPSAKNQLHDIAVLRLEREVRFTHWIRPICLPKAAHLHGDLQNIATTISGWGKTETGFSSNKKLRATVTCVSLEDCNRIYSGFAVSLQETQLCAGGSIGVDSCNGDSGGPLVAIDKTTERYYFYAAGIVSFGPNPCAQKGWPGVYTKVSKYIGWIQSKLQP